MNAVRGFRRHGTSRGNGPAVALARMVGRAPAGPILPRNLRRWLWLVTAVSGALILWVGLSVRDSRRSFWFDLAFARLVQAPEGTGHRVASVISQIGDTHPYTIIAIAVVVGLLLVGDVPAAAVAVGAVGVQLALLEVVLKPFFDRRLPGLDALSYPSGHTSSTFALSAAVALACQARRPLGRALGRIGRLLVPAVFLVGSAAVGLAMIARQAHFPSDVVAGALLGLVTTGVVAAGWDAAVNRLATTIRAGVTR